MILFLLSLFLMPNPTSAETVYLPTKSLPTVLAPNQLSRAIDNFIFRQLSEGLFDIGDGFRIEPRLAESSSVSDDGLTITIKLRKVVLNDGSYVNSNLVVDSISRCVRDSEKTLLIAVQAIKGFESFRSGKVAKLSGLKSIDSTTVSIELVRTSPLLIDELAQVECHIIKPSPAGSLDIVNGAVTIGPYLLDEITPNEIKLKKNPRYTFKTGYPENAVFKKTEEFGNFAALSSWSTMIPVDESSTDHPGFQKVDNSELGTNQVIFNNSAKPFKSLEIRQSISFGLDYFKLATHMGWSFDHLQAGLIPYGMQGFAKRSAAEVSSNRKKAAKILKLLGYNSKNKLIFTVLMPNYPINAKEAEIWPDLFADLPINVRVEFVPYGDYVKRMKSGDFEALRLIKYPGSIEPHRLLASYLTNTPYNDTHSNQPKCDKLIRAASLEADREKRFLSYKSAERCLIEASTLLPLSSLKPSFVMMKQPWALRRTNKYLLYPYWVSEWFKAAK